ncbi:MAG: ABC transporter permease [Candidatus Dormibacteria bacterium]
MIPLLWRRTALARLLLGIAALALGGGAILGSQLASSALRQQAQAAISQAAGGAQYDIAPFSRAGFTASEAAAAARLPGVAELEALSRKPDLARLPSGGFRQVVLVVVGSHGVALRPLPLVGGHSPSQAGRYQIAISQSLSPGFAGATGQVASGGVGLGQQLALTETHAIQRFRVVGVVADSGPGAPFTNDAVYITQAAARTLFSSGLAISDLAVRLTPGSSLSRLMAELPSVLHQDFTVSNPRAVPGGDPVSELQPLLDGMTALSLLLAFVLIAATFSSVVMERRREIGLVRLAGASRGLVLRSFMREGLAVAGLGALLGVGAGYALAAVLVAISNPAGQSPAAQIQFDWKWTAGAFLLVLGVGLLAAAAPAFEAAAVAPLDAVRPHLRRSSRWLRVWPLLMLLSAVGAALAFAAGGGFGVALGAALAYLAVCSALVWLGPALVTGLGEFVGALLLAPVAAVSARSRTRPSRTAFALGSLFVTVATATCLAGLSAAALQSGGLWVNRLFVGNYLVVSPTPQAGTIEGELLGAVRAGPGHPTVSAAAPVRFLSGRVGHVAVSLAATAPSGYSTTGALQFISGTRKAALAALAHGSGALVPLQMANQLDLRLGSAVAVATAGGRALFRVVGVVAHTLPGPAGLESMVISQTAAVHDFGSGAGGFDLIQLAVSGPDAQRAVELAAFRYGMESETVAAVHQGVDRGIQHDIAALGALALVGVVIAILAAINTVVLETRQAARDLALLRVVGLSRAAVRRAVMGEALATAMVGCVLGIVGGVGLTWPEVQAVSSPALPLPFAISPGVIVAVVAAAVLGLLLAATIPARQLSGLDPVAALAVE